MLDATRRVLELYDEDEFQIFIITGNNGYGKSTYANRIIAEVYSIRDQHRWGGNGRTGNWNIKLFKKHMGYHPLEVKALWDKVKYRDYVFHWDDAGTWLSAYDHQDAYVRSIAKYMQVARTDWACIIYSCIDKDDIISKLRRFKSAVIIDITKEQNDPNSPYASQRNRRKATAWHYWKGRLTEQGTENDWEEHFDSHVPGTYTPRHDGKPAVKEGFYGWYKPMRDRYARIAKKGIKYKEKKK